MTELNLDLSGVEAMDDFGPVPPGDYDITVANAEISYSRAGNRMAVLTFEIVGPTHAGRKIWEHFVLHNDVAKRRLKSLVQAGGLPNPNFIRNVEDLHGLRFVGRVAIEEQEGYSPKNTITHFKPIQGSRAAPASTKTAPTQQKQTQQRKSVPPWEAAQS